MEKLRLKEKFAPRVQILSPAGAFIYTVHAEEASRLVDSGQAKRRGCGRRACEVELLQSLSEEQREPPSPPSLRNYMGQAYTRREAVGGSEGVIGYVQQFKRINPRDRPLFMLSVTDCMSPAPHIQPRSPLVAGAAA